MEQQKDLFMVPREALLRGASGLDYRQRGGYRGHRGGRGGRNRYRQPPPPGVVEPTASSEVAASVQTPGLSSQAMDVVTALANVEVPETEPLVTGAVGAADKTDGDRASKGLVKRRRCCVIVVVRGATL